jgi:putative membrane protein
MRNLLIAALATLTLSACEASSTPDFVQEAAMSDLFEIESGKLAIQKGQSDPVIKFGQKMVDDHSATMSDLKGIVQRKNIKVDLPIKLDFNRQKRIDDLNKASVHDFDKTYSIQQVNAHEEAKSVFGMYARSGDDAEVKQFAKKTLVTIIELHLEEAKTLLLAERFGLGRLPGDIVIERDGFRLYFPVMTSIIVSVVLTRNIAGALAMLQAPFTRQSRFHRIR